MKFRAKLQLNGKTATGIEVPEKIVEGLGSGKRPAVTVTLKKHAYRTTIAPMFGSYWIPVSAANREAAGIAAGDTLDVGVELDTAPRTVEVPKDLAKALKADPKAKAAFEKLSYSHKRRHVLAIEEAKKPETRQRRVEKTVETLRSSR